MEQSSREENKNSFGKKFSLGASRNGNEARKSNSASNNPSTTFNATTNAPSTITLSKKQLESAMKIKGRDLKLSFKGKGGFICNTERGAKHKPLVDVLPAINKGKRKIFK